MILCIHNAKQLVTATDAGNLGGINDAAVAVQLIMGQSDNSMASHYRICKTDDRIT